MSRIKIRSMLDNLKFNHNLTSLPKNTHFEITNLAKSHSNKSKPHTLQIDNIRTCYQFTIEALDDEEPTFQTKTSRQKIKQRKDLLAFRQIRRERKSQNFNKSYFTLNSSKNKGCPENLEELGIQKKTIGNRSLRIGQAKKLKFIEERITPTKTKRDRSSTLSQNRGRSDSLTFYKQIKNRSSNKKLQHLANTYNFKLPNKVQKICLPPAYPPRRFLERRQSSTVCPWQNQNCFSNLQGNQ